LIAMQAIAVAVGVPCIEVNPPPSRSGRLLPPTGVPAAL
jgi:hypothetical protein